MTDNSVIDPLSFKKASKAAASLKTGDEDGISPFRKPKVWEVDETATGDSWCD